MLIFPATAQNAAHFRQRVVKSLIGQEGWLCCQS
jgi:hypothetical protein